MRLNRQIDVFISLGWVTFTFSEQACGILLLSTIGTSLKLYVASHAGEIKIDTLCYLRQCTYQYTMLIFLLPLIN